MVADTVAINLALDQAVSQAAREMLSYGDDLDQDTAARACVQLDKLARLRSGERPDYSDRVTPPLYSTWFQLGHVNLAVCVAAKIIEHSRLAKPVASAIGVVDIGSGTFALPIAFDILRLMGKLDTEVTIISVEKSREMEYCGRRIWELFREQTRVTIEGPAPSVRVVYRPDPFFDGAKYFCVMHAAYPGIGDALKLHVAASQPSYGIATINANRRSRDVLDRLERDYLGGFTPKEVEFGDELLKHGMPMTLAYRKWLWERINTLTADRARNIKGLIREPPKWPLSVEAREYALLVPAEDDNLPW